ncbi:MAG: hypothetical protein J5750_00885 [Clostridiales bacterium]|nr:hypothetical protein [Clostridiales bacterium]
MGDKLRKLYIGLAIATGVLGLLVLVIVCGALVSLEKEASLSSEAKDMMYRTAVLTSTEKALPYWENEVEQGHLCLADYVESQFTSYPYLLNGKDDSAFASDLACVAYNDAYKTEEITGLLNGGSRRYAIEKILSDVDPKYAPINGFADPKGTQCGNVRVDKPLENEEGYAFGIRRIDGVMEVEGSELRADFFVDQSLRSGGIEVPKTSGEVPFTMDWDTHGEIPGRHEVVILLRTSDGRGQVLTGGDVLIPEFSEIQNDTVVSSSIPAGEQESWYALDAEDRDAYVNLLEASSDVSAALYDRYGNLIGENDLRDVDYELLRGKNQHVVSLLPEEDTGTASNAFFVRVRRSEAAPPSVAEVSFVLVQSRDVALTEENGYLAVLTDEGLVPTPRPTGAVPDSEKERMVTCRDERGTKLEIARGNLQILPLNEYLLDLKFIGENAEELKIYPEFSMDTFDYAIVGDAFTKIDISYIASEGYAAEVNLLSASVMLPWNMGDDVVIENGVNTFTVEVSGIDGLSRCYTLHLLNGQDPEGFRRDTISQFPGSYADGLWLLHCLHPTYRFEAYQTNLSFEEVLDNEDHVDRSLISSTYNPKWVKPGSPVYDGNSWKAAKREVVSYFLDPRNFLTPTGIFQFEKLSFDASVHTLEGIQAVTKNSFLEGGDDDPDYASILLKAGQDAGISPYFLTSRIIQEMGRDGESELAHGTLPGYEGYYNFYNIGSTPDPNVKNGARINGAKYAMYGSKPEEKQITPEEAAILLPWDTPEKAICGGALWIARSYIEIGQDTLYFQKFDLIDNEDGMYKHQYAQNIAMASSEGIRYYTAYASQDMLDASFVFIIPVYEDMPVEYGNLP